MHVIAYDPFVGAERYRELGVEQAETPDDVYAVADFLTLHLPKTPETEGWLNAEVLAKCKDGVRVLNVARGPLVVDEDLQAALDSGKVGGAALDVFRSEPITDHPLFGYPNVIVTPHLGASTAEATDRAGYQAAEQVVAALTGGVGDHRGQRPGDRRRGHGGARPVPAALPAARAGSRSRSPTGPRSTGVETEFLGRIAERDTRLLALEVAARRRSAATPRRTSTGQRAGDRRGARDRGRRDASARVARDYTDLIRVDGRRGGDERSGSSAR